MPKELIMLTNVASPVWQRAIGAYQVASHCRKAGFSCQVIDFTDMFKIEELEQILDQCIDCSTLALAISTTFFYNKDTKNRYISAKRNFDRVMSIELRELITKIKTKHPRLKIVGGGANSYQIVGDDLFDVIFHGYSEQSVVDYLQGLNKTGPARIWPKVGQQEIVDGKTAHFNIETLEHQWHQNDCVLDNETLPIEISRGCIFKCSFCSYPLNGKKKFDYLRDPKLIADELTANYEKFGTTNYFFTDDTFNDSSIKLERLHRVITELPFKIKFVTYLRLDLLHAHQEQISMLKEIGLGSAFFGIETLNHQSGKAIGKGMNPELVKKFLLDLYHTHWNEEVPITASFIIGLPHETMQSIRNTHAWISNTPINDLWFPLFIKTKSHFQSEFDINYKKYGYQMDQDGNWISDTMTYLQALELAEEFNKTGLYEQNMPSSWLLFSLLSYGYNIHELRKQKLQDLNMPRLMIQKINMFRKYKQALLKAIQK